MKPDQKFKNKDQLKADIDDFQTRIEVLTLTLVEINDQMDTLEKNRAELSEQRRNIQSRISTLRTDQHQTRQAYNIACRPVEVSDHALVRYLERVMGIDVEAVRKKMLSPTVEEMVATGCNRIKTSDSTFVVDDRKIVTVLV